MSGPYASSPPSLAISGNSEIVATFLRMREVSDQLRGYRRTVATTALARSGYARSPVHRMRPRYPPHGVPRKLSHRYSSPVRQSRLPLARKDPVVGSHRTPMPPNAGADLMRICKHFAPKSGKSRNTPVTLPPGRARLPTHPLAIGSLSRSIAITGITFVAPLAACTAVGPAAMMASTVPFTKSAARAGKRDWSPSASRMTQFGLKTLGRWVA